MRHIPSILILLVFLILTLICTRIFLENKELSYISVFSPISCGIVDNKNLDIINFDIDTIKLNDKSIRKNDKKLKDIIYEISHSSKLERGLIISLKNANYKEYIYMLDSFLRNKILAIKYDEEFAYYFPYRLPKQIDLIQTLYINTDDSINPNYTK